MSKRRGRKAFENHSQLVQLAPQHAEAFSFGEPIPVLDKRDILDYAECINNGRWYEPPVSFHGLAKRMRVAVHQSSPIHVKRNILLSTYIPYSMLSQQDFSRIVLDYLTFGNGFAELRKNALGNGFG